MASVIGPIITTGFGLVIAGVGLTLVKKGFHQRRRADRIAATETTDVRNIRPGLVEVKGTARPVEGVDPHRAPISDVEAIASRVEVKKKAGNNWRTVHENRRTSPFVVDDGTGEVRVEPTEDARLNFDDREIEVDPTEEPPRDVKRFAKRSGLVEEQGRSMIEARSRLYARWTYREGVLEPGEEVYVLGEAFEEEAGWGERRFVITGYGSELVVSDQREETVIEEERRQGLGRIALGAFVLLFGLAALVLPLLGVGTWHV